jgi:hypothetical protein
VSNDVGAEEEEGGTVVLIEEGVGAVPSSDAVAATEPEVGPRDTDNDDGATGCCCTCGTAEDDGSGSEEALVPSGFAGAHC